MARPVNKLPLIHPGELLQEDMDALGLSARALADAIAVPHNRIAAILRGERSITADTAVRVVMPNRVRRFAL
ncbi:MAG: HigA family addiction module antidote protein [Gammaproteobacteria bacterium]|nr:HigA family addiction module antidote protein [Gammaproteobacteria bacterium]MBU2477960.1 HigA family addiction module antidote protein [Gammaproteobacteria bacterium]